MKDIGPVRRFLVGVVWIVHLLIVLAFPLGFFIPTSVWPARPLWHFLYAVAAFAMFYLWGLIWTLTLRDGVYAICFVNTFMQWLRGYGMFDKRNYKHGFVREVLDLLGVKVKSSTVTWMLVVCMLISGWLLVRYLRGF